MSFESLIASGAREPPARGTPLRAGPLRLEFLAESGSLRGLRTGDREVLRGIYAAVRDRNWGTVAPRIEGLRLEDGGDSFHIAFHALCREGEIDYLWKGEIAGGPDGTVRFRFHGEARSTFLRNRIGLCVLHPLEGCAGEPCEVEGTDGAVERGAFPRLIAPHQPFKEIRAITHRVAPGLRAEVRLEGEVFEMEDQRNWTDASFKTYPTPLELPFPVKVEMGERTSQSVTLRLLGSPPAAAGRRSGADPGEIAVPLRPALDRPPVGLQLASHGRPLTAREAERLRLLGLPHLRADLRLRSPQWRAVLERAAREADLLGTSLHLALFLGDDAEGELAALAGAIRTARAPVSLFLVHREGEKAASVRLARLAADRLPGIAPGVPWASGTDAHFAELNRGRPPPDSPALPCWSMTPQVHAFDSASIVETLEAQPSAVETARSFSSHPAVISPITLRPRFNPVATEEPAEGSPSRGLPPQVDPRQLSLFCAGWTMASIARLGAAGVHSLTYFETTGWRGVMEREEGSPLPEEFPSIPGAAFPVFHALAFLSGFGRMAPAASSEPLAIEALVLFDAGGRCRVLAANLSSEERVARLVTGARRARVRVLDASCAEEAMRSPEGFLTRPGEVSESVSGVFEVRLGPHALACVDLE